MALKLDVIANTRGVVSEMKKAGASVEDVTDALDDMAKDASKDGDKLERTFKDLARASSRAADDIGDDMRKGFRRAEDSAERFGTKAKDELQDSAREGAASFSGEFSDIGDVLQEATANLGPAGIAGGAIIGAMIATATAAVEEWNEKIDGIKESTAEMWQSAAEQGEAFISAEAIRSEAFRILWEKSYDEQLRAAESAGVSRAEFALALAEGEGETYDRVHKQIMAARQEEIDAARDAMNAGVDGNVAIQDAVTSVNSELARTVTVLEEKGRATEDNKRKAQDAAAVESTQQEKIRTEVGKTKTALDNLVRPRRADIRLRVDTTELDNAENRAAAWARRGITVPVTGILQGKGVWE